MAANDRARVLGLTGLFGLLVVLGIPLVAFLWAVLNDVLAGDLSPMRVGSALISLGVFSVFVAGLGRVLRRLEPDEA